MVSQSLIQNDFLNKKLTEEISLFESDDDAINVIRAMNLPLNRLYNQMYMCKDADGLKN